MINADVIIVGGGPAGSSCAKILNDAKINAIILEKNVFPRTKLCAGWITKDVLKSLDIDMKSYPHGILRFDTLNLKIFGMDKKVRTKEYSIRRYEFDDFLLKRSGVKVYNHEVRKIIKKGDSYIIDDKYRCKYLVGAGGTFCPVYNTFFKDINPRSSTRKVVAMEEEFKYDTKDKACYLWFFDNKLPGYAWVVPKAGGYINVGIGGQFEKIKDKNNNVKNQWERFVKEVEKKGLVKKYRYNPRGYVYYIRQNVKRCRKDNAFIIGDSAGLATVDLAEGIGPAIDSGILCAESIINGTEYSLNKIKKHSLKGWKRILFRLVQKIYV